MKKLVYINSKFHIILLTIIIMLFARLMLDPNALGSHIDIIFSFSILFLLMFAAYLYENRVNRLEKKSVDLEQQVKEEKLKYDTIFNEFPAIYSLTDLNTFEYIEVNSVFLRLSGYTKEELLNKTTSEVNLWVHEEDKQKYLHELRQYGNVNSCVVEMRHKDGKTAFYSISSERVMIDGRACLIHVSNDVTEEIKVKRELENSRQMYSTLVENVLYGVFVVQNDKYIYVNDQFAKLLLLTPKELIGTVFTKHVHPEDLEIVVEYNRLRKAGGNAPDEYEIRVINSQGQIRYVRVYGRIVEINGIKSTLGSIKDVTEFRETQKALKENQESMQEMLEFLPQPIFDIDLNGRFTYMNTAGKVLFDFDPNSYSYTIMELLAPEDRSRARDNIQELLYENLSSEPIEYTCFTPAGKKIIGLIAAKALRSEDKIVGIRGIFFDITQRKLDEEFIRKLSRALEQSPVSIVMTNSNGVIEFVNPKACSVSGYDQNELIGQKPSILKSGRHSTEFYQELWNTITSGNEWRGEIYNRRKNGSFYWESVSISPIRNSQGQITNYIALKEDITEKKKLEEDLILAKEKAEESDQLKSNFLSQISHEIRTPINTILGYNSYLKGELKDKLDSNYIEIFDNVQSAAKRLFRTIDLILNISVLRTGNIKPKIKSVNPEKLILIVLREYKSAADLKGLNLTFLNKLDGDELKTDEYMLSHIVHNLVDNAIKFTKSGSVAITAEKCEKDIVLSVEDTGIGMPDSYIMNSFSLFSQNESGYGRSFEGNGLGLNLVKGYADLLNAKIKVESMLGRGTKISVSLKDFEIQK